MEPTRVPRRRLLDLKAVIPGVLVFLVTGLLVSSRWATPSRADVPVPGQLPPDGKYANVSVEGRVVPMIHVMHGGSIVLVDTDGKKPRTWEEQFKRKGDLPPGKYNLHKTDVNGNDEFADDPVDRQGLWEIDSQANIVQR